MLKSLKAAFTSVRSATSAQSHVEIEFLEALKNAAKSGDYQKPSFMLTAMAVDSFGIVNELINFTQNYTLLDITLAGDETYCNHEGAVMNAKKVKACKDANIAMTSYRDW